MSMPLRLGFALALAGAGFCPLAFARDGVVHTDRQGARPLRLPVEDDAFAFAIFGDRAGGPVAGIEVVRQAVAEVNLLDPDLVMTVGDLVNGYNTRDRWLPQMREFRDAMAGLEMPWFPVVGNHDIYWRGPGRPPEEHEGDFEEHLGPLWYAFEHKDCWFIALYSDEPNPATGERNFSKPECQRMSPRQFGWLRTTLARAKAARHVFVFLHHPRWIESRYGDSWKEVHRQLVDAGNVRAVFAGHIHYLRYDGCVDGIEYFALATTGGSLPAGLEQAGHLHEFHVVTVRDAGISVACLPVGSVVDPRRYTAAISEGVARLDRQLRPMLVQPLVVALDGAVDEVIQVCLTNPSDRPIDVTLVPAAAGRRWSFWPDHDHRRLAPGQEYSRYFRVLREPGPLDETFAVPSVELDCEYLGEALRVPLRQRSVQFDCVPPPFAPAAGGPDLALDLAGGQCLRVRSDRLAVPDGPLTLEGWLCGSDFSGRRAFVTKTESSEFGLFVGDGKPAFSIHLAGAYASAAATETLLEPGVWHHLAGVFDGREVRLYLDGRLLATTPGHGRRTPNDFPLYVGADPDSRGAPCSGFAGVIDEVRLSSTARYAGPRFTPERRHEADADTLLLLHLDETRAVWVADSSPRRTHPELVGFTGRTPLTPVE